MSLVPRVSPGFSGGVAIISHSIPGLHNTADHAIEFLDWGGPSCDFWRGLAIFLLGGVGTAFGVTLGFFLFPFVFPAPPAMEQLTEADRSTLFATGNFIHANPSDPFPYGKAKVSVYQHAVLLVPDFDVGPGPPSGKGRMLQSFLGRQGRTDWVKDSGKRPPPDDLYG